MQGLVVQKDKFSSHDGREFFTLLISQKTNDGDFRLVMDKKSHYKEPRRFFVASDLFDFVGTCHIYEFHFGADESTGWTCLKSADLIS